MKPMSLERFRRLVESYGGNSSRWPETERAPALSLLALSDEARALQQAESALDFACDELELPAAPRDLERRLNEIPIRHARRRGWPFGAFWAPVVGFAAAAACGVWLGSAFPEDESVQDEDTVSAAAPSTESLLEFASGSFADLEELP